MNKTALNSLLLSTAFVWYTNAQIHIRGLVTNQEGEPIPWCNLGIPHESTGAYSLRNGIFDLEIRKKNLDDTLVFSHIGYKTRRIPIHKISPKILFKVVLEDSVTILKEVVVKALNNIEPKRIGIFRNNSNSDISIAYPHKGSEVGLIINGQSNSFYFNRIFVKYRKQNLNNVRLRMRIYRIGENALPYTVLSEVINDTTHMGNQGQMSFRLDEMMSIEFPIFISFQWLIDQSDLAEIEELNTLRREIAKKYVTKICKDCIWTVYNEKKISIQLPTGEEVQSYKLTKKDSRLLRHAKSLVPIVSILTTKSNDTTYYRSHSLGKWYRYDQNIIAWAAILPKY